MKKLFLIPSLLIVAALTASTQIPTKVFDVRNGNGIIDAGVTLPQATYIVYKDAASKNLVIQNFCDNYGYQTTIPNPAFDPTKPVDPVTNAQTIPNPQSKQAFFNRFLTSYIRGHLENDRKTKAQATAAAAVDTTDLP